jgi:hypothetical protein
MKDIRRQVERQMMGDLDRAPAPSPTPAVPV